MNTSREGPLWVVALLALGGCAAFARGTPIVYWDPEAPSATGKPVEVEAAVNQTGQTFELDVASVFTERLRAGLHEARLGPGGR